MANDMRYLSAEEEAKLLKPIDEYVGTGIKDTYLFNKGR